MNLPLCLTPHTNSVTLAVKVQPKAKRNAFAGMVGNELRIALIAPPVDDAANELLVRFLAEQLGCARGQIEFVRGRTSRHKLLRISGVPIELIAEKVAAS